MAIEVVEWRKSEMGAVFGCRRGFESGGGFWLFCRILLAFRSFRPRFKGCRVRVRAFSLFWPGGRAHRVGQGALGGFLGVTLGLVSPYRRLLRGSATCEKAS